MSWIQKLFSKKKGKKSLIALARSKQQNQKGVNQGKLRNELEDLLHHHKTNKGNFFSKLKLSSLKKTVSKDQKDLKFTERLANINFLDPTGKIKKQKQFKRFYSTAFQGVFLLGIILGLGVVGASIVNNSSQQAKASSNYFCPDTWTNLNNGQCVKAADSKVIYSCPDGGVLSASNCIIQSNGPSGCSNGAVNPPTCDTVNSKSASSSIVYECVEGSLSSSNLCSIQASIANCPNGAVNPPICTVYSNNLSSDQSILSSVSSTQTSSQVTFSQPDIDENSKIVSSDKITFNPNSKSIQALQNDVQITFSDISIPSGSTCSIQIRPVGQNDQSFVSLKLINSNSSYDGSCRAVFPKNNQSFNKWEILVNIKTATDKFYSLATYEFQPAPIPAGIIL